MTVSLKRPALGLVSKDLIESQPTLQIEGVEGKEFVLANSSLERKTWKEVFSWSGVYSVWKQTLESACGSDSMAKLKSKLLRSCSLYANKARWNQQDETTHRTQSLWGIWPSHDHGLRLSCACRLELTSQRHVIFVCQLSNVSYIQLLAKHLQHWTVHLTQNHREQHLSEKGASVTQPRE